MAASSPARPPTRPPGQGRTQQHRSDFGPLWPWEVGGTPPGGTPAGGMAGSQLMEARCLPCSSWSSQT